MYVYNSITHIDNRYNIVPNQLYNIDTYILFQEIPICFNMYHNVNEFYFVLKNTFYKN